MNRSESISHLAVALVKFNAEISKVAKDANNPFFKNKYATLDNIIDEARPVLTKNGLSILQLPAGDGEHAIIKTLLLHESGEWIESEPLLMKPVKNDPQAYGSCITYMRRYSLTSFLSLNTGEDDDGNQASQPKPQMKPNVPKVSEITQDQIKRLYTIANSKGYDEKKVKAMMAKKYNVESTKDLTKVQYDEMVKGFESLANKES